ncbi:pentapeptide repeat-containing protein [Streptomyces inhibens]|uniref:pentapeptide repeat-containing protein n=1 Tax=Streptomyces inhibens TaxID=2293571 RepID=UPI00315ABF8A
MGGAKFESATFEGDVWFESVTFEDIAWFESATFKGHAGFQSATFKGSAGFDSAAFEGKAGFESATFKGDAWFESATFKEAVTVGPLVCAGRVLLSGATFDGKHEPGAADFYYGEMEMRRHADDIPRSERGLLAAYWALSGYGLRASRALAWLGAAMLLTIVLLMAVGLAKNTPKQTATGTVPAGGGKVTFEIDKDDPQSPTGNRFTGKRFEKALNVTLNSVVFRSSGQDLTTAGTYIEMSSRLTEPVLLTLAVLAVRNRVKR